MGLRWVAAVGGRRREVEGRAEEYGGTLKHRRDPEGTKRDRPVREDLQRLGLRSFLFFLLVLFISGIRLSFTQLIIKFISKYYWSPYLALMEWMDIASYFL